MMNLQSEFGVLVTGNITKLYDCLKFCDYQIRKIVLLVMYIITPLHYLPCLLKNNSKKFCIHYRVTKEINAEDMLNIFHCICKRNFLVPIDLIGCTTLGIIYLEIL